MGFYCIICFEDSFQSDEIELKVPDLKKAIPNSLEAMLYVSGEKLFCM